MFFRKKDVSRKSHSELVNENKQLQLQIMGLIDQIENLKKIAFKYQAEYNNLVKRVRKLSFSILHYEYARNQLGSGDMIQDMDIYQLLDYTEQKFREINAEERGYLAQLAEQLNKKEEEIESLKVQLSRLLTKEQHRKKYSEDEHQIIGSEENELETKTREDKVEEKSTKEKENSSSLVFKTNENVVKVSIIENEDVSLELVNKNETIKSSLKKEKDEDKEQMKRQYKNMPRYLQENLNKEESSARVVIAESRSEKPPVEDVKTVKAVERIKNQLKNQTNSTENVKAHIVNLNDYMDKMSNVMWDIVYAIGGQGLSESKDIKRIVVNNEVTESAFNTALSQLRKMNIIDQERINTGWRWFHAYELSDIGSRIFIEKYKKNPVECEKQLLKKQHTSALHGYCIKDAAEILKVVFGYDETSTDRRCNSLKLYTGETYIPDIIAKKKEGAIVDYFEVELGHHTQSDFNNKCDKMLMVTKNLYFIVPDAEIMNKTLARQIGQWVLERGGKEKLKGTTIYLTTLKKLNDGKWENIYPF